MNNKSFENELKLIDLIKKINKSKRIVFSISLFFVLCGIITSLLLPVKYSSSTIFISQSQESNNSSLSGVASLVGINLGSSSFGSEIPLSTYPLITRSPEFKRLLLNKIIDKNDNLTLKNFLVQYHKLDFVNSEIMPSIYVSQIEEECFEILDDIISVQINQKEGFITISTVMSIAKYTALVANYSREILQDIIIKNKIERAKQNLEFSENQLKTKKVEFNKIQSKLAVFKDSNLNIVNSSIVSEQDRLEAEFEIINAVVTELSKQVESAKLQVKRDTPIFSSIKQAVIPNKRDSPKRTQLVIIFGFVGFLFSIGYVLIREVLIDLYHEILK